MNYKKYIIDELNALSGRYSTYEVFADWIKMEALSISQRVDYKDAREKEYLDVANKYTKDELVRISKLSGALTLAYETEGMSDILGAIYMSKDMGSNKLGQFFTPYHLCQMMSELHNIEELLVDDMIVINEPSVGAGGNIIAFCEHLKNKGYNYQQIVEVIAQDLDYKAVYMSYVQFSLLGIPAKVYQGDTLKGTLDEDNVFITPAYLLSPLTFKARR